MKLGLVPIAATVCGLVLLTPAAAVQRTYVGSTGNDANPCSLAQPCRQFSAAIAQTTAGGEVIVLDSAGYGSVTIDRSVSIIAPDGVYAGVTVSSGNGVTMGTAAIEVVLKGLVINGLGGANGILMTNGASLRVENCAVSGFASNGTAAINVSAPAKVVISDTVVARSYVGILLDGGANAAITRVKAIGNALHGIILGGPSNATTTAIVSDSLASQNAVCGYYALGTGSTGGIGGCTTCTRKLTVVNSVASGNNFGMCEGGTNGIIAVGNSASTDNAFNGFYQVGGGTFRSAENNVLTGNGSAPTSGTITPGGLFY